MNEDLTTSESVKSLYRNKSMPNNSSTSPVLNGNNGDTPGTRNVSQKGNEGPIKRYDKPRKKK